MPGLGLSRRFDLTPLRLLWLGLALLGAGLGLWQEGAVPASGGWLSSDRVAMLALGIWCMVETMVRRNWLAFLTFPALLLGLGCALPLYLFIRSRRIV